MLTHIPSSEKCIVVTCKGKSNVPIAICLSYTCSFSQIDLPNGL